MFPRFLVVIVLLFSFAEARAQSSQSQQSQRYQPAGLNVPPPLPDLFEVSLGFNYIYLDNQFPETKNLYGVETSAFINATSWLAAGGEFMADFGSHSVPAFFNRTIDVDSQRYVYVFGPRVTVWHNPQFRVFVEGLAGGIHAEAKFTLARFSSSISQTASADGFATVLGAGFDWRLTNHLSWRVVQADYLGTDLSSQWQSNFRASTSIVYSFGRP
ncbi:MAG TPA: hypothetical protein VNX27_10925 [Chthoniobacterales bacterium]|nr:hypothetical protein [Chthoniobacterales bacterium]